MKQEIQTDATGPDTAMRLSMEIVDRMGEGVGLTRCRDGVIIYGNPAVIRMFGYDHDDMAGSPFTNLLPGGDKDSAERAARVMEYLKTHKAWNGEVENVRKDGSRFWTHLTVTTLNHPEHGEVWMGVYEDITERKRMEEQLREDRKTIQALMDASIESAALLDVDGTILAANAALASSLGKRIEDLIGNDLFSLFPTDVARGRKERMDEVIRSGQTIRFQDRRDGRIFDITICPVLSSAGKVVRLAAFGEDITERTTALEELHRANDLLQKMAHTDDLTGLPNRRCLLEALAREVHRINRYGGEAVVGIVDVDHFKVLNDTHGHAVGDRVLTELAVILRAQVRQSDMVGRYGGDEFVILLSNNSAAGAINVVERIRAAFSSPSRTPEGSPVWVTFSAGLAPVPQNTTPEAVLQLADLALYEAKTAGRNCTRISRQPGKESSGDTSSP